MSHSDIAGMWVVAVALVGAVGAHDMLPDMPPRLAYGVETLGPRIEFTEPGIAGPVTLLNERSNSAPAKPNASDTDFAEVVHGITRRMLGC